MEKPKKVKTIDYMLDIPEEFFKKYKNYIEMSKLIKKKGITR